MATMNPRYRRAPRYRHAGGPQPSLAQPALGQPALALPAPRGQYADYQVVRPRRKTMLDALVALRPPLDGAYGFCMFAAMLFVQELGSLAGLVISVLPLLYVALRPRTFSRTLASAWPVLLLPLFCILSAVWSDYVGATLRYGAEYLITAFAAVTLISARRSDHVVKGMLLAFIAYGVGSMAFGRFVGVGMGGSGEAFVGLGDGKNMMADIASIGLVAALSVLFISIRQRRILWCLVALFGVALEAYLLVAARSAGALLGVGAALTAMLAVLLAMAVSRPVRIMLIGLLAASAAIFASVFQEVAGWMLSTGLALFDKDPTLTGRTYLWYRANDLAAERPELGRGFAAFWQQGNPDAEGLWQYAGIASRSGFNFHNSPTEILIELGYVGLALFALVALLGLWGLLKHYVNRPSLTLTFWLGLTAYFAIRAPFEALGTGPFYYSTALMLAAAGLGLQPAPRPARVPRMRLSAFVRRRQRAAGGFDSRRYGAVAN